MFDELFSDSLVLRHFCWFDRRLPNLLAAHSVVEALYYSDWGGQRHELDVNFQYALFSSSDAVMFFILLLFLFTYFSLLQTGPCDSVTPGLLLKLFCLPLGPRRSLMVKRPLACVGETDLELLGEIGLSFLVGKHFSFCLVIRGNPVQGSTKQRHTRMWIRRTNWQKQRTVCRSQRLDL